MHGPPHPPPFPPPHHDGGNGGSWRPHLPQPKVTQNVTLNLTTALGANHSLIVELLKFEFKLPHLPARTSSGVVVNHHVLVVFADGVALNGAIHVVDRLLVPPHGPPRGSPPGRGRRGRGRRGRRGPGRWTRETSMDVHDEEWNAWTGGEGAEHEPNEWEDWEDWLIEWATDVEVQAMKND